MDFGEKKNFTVFTVFAVLTTVVLRTTADDCAFTTWSYANTPCNATQTEIYKDFVYDQSSRLCCKRGSKGEKDRNRAATSCRVTKCLSATTRNSCSVPNLYDRYINGRKLEYEEFMREPCTIPGTRDRGFVALCCQPNSVEAVQVSTYGAEQNEFPHQVKVLTSEHCGGTIYNKRWVLTAAHCVMSDYGVVENVPMQVFIGTNIADVQTEDYAYNVETVVVHDNYSRNWNHSEFLKKDAARYFNDIALLKLDRDIIFTDKVKALEIAPDKFNPFQYADKAIMVGWGTTDTLAIVSHLQKGNVLLRDDYKCLQKHSDMAGLEDSLLCVGGIMDGKFSYIAGQGDSGGPAICRNKDGNPLLCGLSSFGVTNEYCAASWDEAHCPPSVYTEIAHFNDWINITAGPQDSNTFYRPYLYGKTVTDEGEYEHQVHITSSNGKSCGGTLIRPNILVTAAQCALTSSGKMLYDLKVTTGINDLMKGGKETFGVNKAMPLSGFRRNGKPVNIAAQGNRVRLTDNYYKNDLAVLKLDGTSSISQEKLPVLPQFGQTFYEGTEIAFPRDTSKSGQLRSREFRILDMNDCQTRMDRLSYMNLNEKVDDNILCGVEKYSGGSTCDRELGGGLICKGRGGQDVLCGVQIFRLCEFALPNAFMNMALYSSWVEDSIKRL